MRPTSLLPHALASLFGCGAPFAVAQSEPDPEPGTVTVTVVDDLGQPVPDAVVVRVSGDVRVPWITLPELPLADPYWQGRQWSGWADRHEHPTDAKGQATVRLPAGEALLLAVHGPRHIHTAMGAPADAVPPNVQLVATRGGFVCGQLDAKELLAHARLLVCGIREGGPDPETRWPSGKYAFGAEVEASGRFRSGPLEPGRYRIGVQLWSGMPHGARRFPVDEPLPLLSDEEFALPPVTVDIAAGTECPIKLEAPVCGELTGSVLVADRPVADAIVCAEWNLPFHFQPFAEDVPDAYRYRDHCRTDAEGRYRFLVGSPSTFELSVRLAKGISWSAPVTLTFPTTATRREHEFTAPTAAIRGSLGDIPGRHPHRLELRLQPLADAGEGPPHPWVDDFEEKWVPRTLAGEGDAFAFEGLTAGRWVLRVGEERCQSFWQIVTTTAGERTELGKLLPPRTVPVELACVLPAGHWVELHQRVADSEHEVFVLRTAPGEGRLVLGSLPPGSFRLHTLLWWWGGWDRQEEAQPAIRKWVDFEVRPDGTCVPALVDFTWFTQPGEPGKGR